MRSHRRSVGLLLEPAIELYFGVFDRMTAIELYFGIFDRMKLSASFDTPCVGSVMKSLGVTSSSQQSLQSQISLKYDQGSVTATPLSAETDRSSAVKVKVDSDVFTNLNLPSVFLRCARQRKAIHNSKQMNVTVTNAVNRRFFPKPMR